MRADSVEAEIARFDAPYQKRLGRISDVVDPQIAVGCFAA